MDEVARERASSAHRRLDGINGQIGGLRDEIADLRVDVAKVQTRTGIYAAIAAFIAAAVVAPFVSSKLHLNDGQQAKPRPVPAAVVRAER